MFVSLYTTRLILNSLGASDFGIFNIVGGAIAMLGFLNGAMASATQRFMSYSEGEGNKEKQKSIFNVSIVLHLLIAFVVGIALLVAGYFFFNGILNIPPDRIDAAQVVYGSLIVSTMFTVMSVPYDAVMNAHENMKYYAVVGIIESFLKLSVAFACVYTTLDKLIVYGILMACIPLIILTIMRVYCHRHYSECHIAVRTYWDKGLMKEMTGFAGWSFLGSMSSLLGNYGNSIVLNHFFGTLLNAAQGIANQLNGQLLVFTNNMTKALNPVIVKKEGSGERLQMIKTSATGCKMSFFMLSVLAVPVIIEMPYILKIWLENVPEWAVVFTRLQLVRTLIEQVTLVFSVAIAAQGNIKYKNIVSCVLNLFPVTINYLLFSYGYSPIFMYVSNIAIFGVLLSGMNVYFMKKNCGMKYRFFMKYVFIPIATVFILHFGFTYLIAECFEEGLFRLFVVGLISTISFLILFLLLGINCEEKIILNNVIVKFKSRIRYLCD